MTLKTLTELHLGNKNCQSFNFHEGVAPVIDTIGPNLHKLILEDFTEVDVDYIGQKKFKADVLIEILTTNTYKHPNLCVFLIVPDSDFYIEEEDTNEVV